MFPISLRLIGFRGIQDGLNRSEIFIDFTKLPLGMIAIIGGNGNGKSTIMDNSHPYRLMPSRSDKYSVRSFSFFDHLVPGKGRKEFIWKNPDGKTYKSDLIFTTKSKKTDCYVYVFEDDQWKEFRSPDGNIISDGKAETHDRAIEFLNGSPEMFFTSQYLCQNRKALSTYGNSEMKSLLSEMLGIEKIKEQSKNASEVAEILSKELERRKTEVAKMSHCRIEIERIQTNLEASNNKLEQFKLSKSSLFEKLNSNISTLQTLEQSVRDGEQDLIRINELNGRISQYNTERNTCLNQRKLRAESDLKASTKLETQIKSFESQIYLKPQVEEAIRQLPIVERGIADAEVSINNIRDKWEIANLKKQHVFSLESELKSCATKGQGIKLRGKELEITASLIDNVPCKSMEINGHCPLLSNAHKAKTEFVKVFDEYNQTKDEYRDIQIKLNTVQIEVGNLGDVKKMLDLANQELISLREKQLKFSNLATKAGQITEAELNLGEMRSLLATMKAEMVESQKASLEQENGILNNIKHVEAQLSNLRSLDFSSKIRECNTVISTTRAQIATVEGQIEAEIRNQSRLTAEIGFLNNQLLNEENLQNCINALSAEISYWRQMQHGLGNNGVIALCIDDAGPRLSGFVNELLGCFGSRYSIEIKTQYELSDGQLREGFEIIVHDSRNTEPKKLEFMSGGEKVWINDCLCRGMALYRRQTSNNNSTTLFSDETDGALDPDHKRQFMKMKSLVMKLSGCEREFFISHTPDCIDMADGVIDLSEYAIVNA